MAAKNQQETNKLKKRKLNAGAKVHPNASTSKKPKVTASKPSKTPQNKEFNKPFNPIKQKQNPFKPKFGNKDANEEQTVPKSKRERRLHAKELAEARKKKRKRHYDLEQELASLWEKMRQRNIAKEDRSKLISEAVQKMKGKIPEIAGSHVSSRVLQTCVKYCSQTERDAVFEELQPHFLTLADNTYAVHLEKKMLDSASKKQLARFISALHGHVASLLRHMVGSVVIEHAYQLANATQKHELLVELYSTELQLFKDLVSIKESRLVDVISKLGLQKASVLRHMASVIQPILEKGIVDHSIIHRVLMEYFSIADKTSAADIIQQLSGPLLVRMIHTRDGSKIGILCVKHGSAKERKKIIKGMKGHIGKIAHDQCGSLVLLCIVSIVDDTKLITKIVLRELQTNLKELVLDKNGRRVLLQLLHPNCSRYLSPDDLASLNLFISSLSAKDETQVNSEIKSVKNEESNDEMADQGEAAVRADESTSPSEDLHLVEGGKKDPYLRRQELLVNSGLAESLIDICIENAGELLRSNFGREVLYEVARGGSDDILRPTLDDKLNTLHEAVASLTAESKSEESEEEHTLENFHSSRTIRKLVMDCPTFASTLWKKALKGKCEVWAQGHSCKVVSAFLESSDSKVRELAKKELQPLLDRVILKIPEAKKAAHEG
ncbi:pumilio homolog 24 [Pistacia vera]|uniref:pumilio homolog 24 n=1 Tax=Pistacia vera TaxID=55513 RepID=UPI001263BA98|nr:pumilio homolog 24 [Pistacia vera]